MKKIKDKNKLNRSSKALMTCDLINTIVSLFGETFLVAYFLQVTNENIVQVSTYYITVYALLGIGSILLGNAIKSSPRNRVIIYRISTVVKSIYILLMVLFKENISQYFMIFATFYGIAESLYWSAHDVMNIEIVNNENRKNFMVTKRILGKVINIVVPIILGTSIELTSFVNIAIYIFALTLIQIIISLSIDINKFWNNEKKEKYSLKNYFKKLLPEQKEKLSKIYKLSFLYGIIMDTIRVIVIVIIIMQFKTSFNLGILTTVFSIFSMISLSIFNKVYKASYAKTVLISCSTLVVLGVLGLLLNIDRTTLIIYNFAYNIIICVLEVMFKIKADDVVNECGIGEWQVEHRTIIELGMDFGRIVGFLAMLLIGILNNILYFKLLLLIVTISIPIYSKILYKVEKHI